MPHDLILVPLENLTRDQLKNLKELKSKQNFSKVSQSIVCNVCNKEFPSAHACRCHQAKHFKILKAYSDRYAEIFHCMLEQA